LSDFSFLYIVFHKLFAHPQFVLDGK
jgi:hypothetical protein